MRRSRTTKKLAKRIDMDYFARPHPLRRWRFWLSVALPVVGVVWLVSARAIGDREVYSSGPLSPAHAVFTQQCNACHLVRAGVFREHVTDQACLTCHDAPQHNARQTFAPECGSCHVEHSGKLQLERTADASCTQCHGNLALHVKDANPHFENAILRFSGQHPEFAALRPGKTDPGTVKLNHYAHLQPTLKGPDGRPVQLDCSDCHRPPAASQEWKYADPQLKKVSSEPPAGLTERPYPRDPRLAYMAPIKYSKQCQGCHQMQFDKRFPESVPHDKPEIIHQFLVKKFSEYIAAHPGDVRQVTAPELVLPGPTRPTVRPAANASEWITLRVAEAEQLLWNKTCKQCHTLNFASGAPPAVAKPNITERWLPHAVFDHQAHTLLKCDSCHRQVPKSRDTADVLIPDIKTCQACHVSGAQAQARNVAEGSCFECHQYHDWGKRRPTPGRYTIPELLGHRAAAAGTNAGRATGMIVPQPTERILQHEFAEPVLHQPLQIPSEDQKL